MPLEFNKIAIPYEDSLIQTYHLNERSDEKFYFSHANGFNGLTYQSLLKKRVDGFTT